MLTFRVMRFSSLDKSRPNCVQVKMQKTDKAQATQLILSNELTWMRDANRADHTSIIFVKGFRWKYFC
jgi:hypothetical protein